MIRSRKDDAPSDDVFDDVMVDFGGHFAMAGGFVRVGDLEPFHKQRLTAFLDGMRRADDAEAQMIAAGVDPQKAAEAGAMYRKLAKYAGAGECEECGSGLSWTSNPDGSWSVAEACVHPGGVGPFSVEIDVPSGRLVFANDLRGLVELKTLDDSHYVNHTCEIVRCSRDHADVGLVHLFVGNSCPGVYRLSDGRIFVGREAADAECEGEGEEAVPSRSELLGSICTDLWWFGAMDHDAFQAALAADGASEDDVGDFFVVDVPAGRWRFTAHHHVRRRDRGHGEEELMAMGEFAGPCLGAAQETPDEGDGNPLHASEFWRRWLLTQKKWNVPTLVSHLHQNFCVLGNGMRWNRGVLRSSGRDARFAKLDDPTLPDRSASKELDRVPVLPEGALDGFVDGDSDPRRTPRKRRAYPMAEEYVLAGSMPLEVDVFHLAAALMFFKTLSLQPDVLADNSDILGRKRHDGTDWAEGEAEEIVRKTHEEQVWIVRRCLDAMLAIAEARGLWEDGSLDKAFSLLLKERVAFVGPFKGEGA